MQWSNVAASVLLALLGFLGFGIATTYSVCVLPDCRQSELLKTMHVFGGGYNCDQYDPYGINTV